MKTNQVLIRKMGSFNVEQRTSDAMFNATNLLRQWNNDNPNEIRELDNFWKSTNLDKLMSEIAENELNLSSVDFTDLKKALSTTSRANKGENSGTWMHPILYIKFAMYLSPKFEYYVLRFVSDQLLQFRNDAGDSYREMTTALKTINDDEELRDSIKQVARALNFVVYNAHYPEIRNKLADENKLKELSELERNISSVIKCGLVKSQQKLISYLRDLWKVKYLPKVFTN